MSKGPAKQVASNGVPDKFQALDNLNSWEGVSFKDTPSTKCMTTLFDAASMDSSGWDYVNRGRFKQSFPKSSVVRTEDGGWELATNAGQIVAPGFRKKRVSEVQDNPLMAVKKKKIQDNSDAVSTTSAKKGPKKKTIPATLKEHVESLSGSDEDTAWKSLNKLNEGLENSLETQCIFVAHGGIPKTVDVMKNHGKHAGVQVAAIALINKVISLNKGFTKAFHETGAMEATLVVMKDLPSDEKAQQNGTSLLSHLVQMSDQHQRQKLCKEILSVVLPALRSFVTNLEVVSKAGQILWYLSEDKENRKEIINVGGAETISYVIANAAPEYKTKSMTLHLRILQDHVSPDTQYTRSCITGDCQMGTKHLSFWLVPGNPQTPNTMVSAAASTRPFCYKDEVLGKSCKISFLVDGDMKPFPGTISKYQAEILPDGTIRRRHYLELDDDHKQWYDLSVVEEDGILQWCDVDTTGQIVGARGRGNPLKLARAVSARGKTRRSKRS
jgi:hypothetical protein